MVKSKLPFEDFDQGGLTGYVISVRLAYRDLPILGVNTYGKKEIEEPLKERH
jgi:hypothetical protein